MGKKRKKEVSVFFPFSLVLKGVEEGTQTGYGSIVRGTCIRRKLTSLSDMETTRQSRGVAGNRHLWEEYGL